MTFDYEECEVQPFPGQLTPGIVFRPIVRIRILGAKSQIRFRGLADSGADMTVLPKSVADYVGCEMLPNVPGYVSGVGGGIELSYAKVLFEIASGKKTHRWCATVGIAEGTWTEAILGHAGFLQFFDANFMGHTQVLRLKRNKKPFQSTELFNA